MVASTQSVLLAGNTMPAKSVKDLIQITKGKPRQISFASAGNGTPSHLAGEMFNVMAGVEIVHRPYKGSVPAIADLAEGRVELSFSNLEPLLSRINSGELKALGVTGKKRSIFLPDVPTIAEAGVTGYEASTWFGVFAPAKTPREIIRKLNIDIVGVLKSSDLKEKLASQGVELTGNTPEQFATVISADINRWAVVVKAAGIRSE